MSRVINLDSAGKQRTQLAKAIVLAIRELALQKEPNAEARDLAAFISIALNMISEGIDISVAAWEKRGYWVKADKFRMEWDWAGPAGLKMQNAVLSDDWAAVAILSAQIAQKFAKVRLSENHRLGRPWAGSWETLKAH